MSKDAGEKPAGKAARSARAAELAAKAIDNMIDPAAPPEERGRRLTKGPLEFREHRVDLPKAKGKWLRLSEALLGRLRETNAFER